MELLTDDQIADALADLPGWERAGAEIRRRFDLPSFADAMAFVVRVGFLAEAANHHPDLDVRYRTVHIALSTHSAGGLTGNDFSLARAVEGLPR